MKAETNPFNPKVVYGLILLGILTLGAMVWVMAYGSGSQRQQEVSRAQMSSPSAVGFKGLIELVAAVRRSYTITNLHDLDYEDLLVLAVDGNVRREDIAYVRQQREARATLIILPKWRTAAEPTHAGWVRPIGVGAGDRIARDLGYRLHIVEHLPAATQLAGADILGDMAMAAPVLPQVIEGDGLIPLLVLPNNGGTVLAQVQGHPLYILADPDLLNNQGLRDPGRARSALALLDQLNSTNAQSVNFATFTEADGQAAKPAHDILRLAIEPPFLAMTLALLIAALLAALHGAVRFGQARREARAIALGKAALVENSAGLIRLARREAQMGIAYAEFIQQEAARAVGAPPALQGDALDEYLDRLTRGGPDFSTLATNLARARDRHAMAAAARALFQWKKDIIR